MIIFGLNKTQGSYAVVSHCSQNGDDRGQCCQYVVSLNFEDFLTSGESSGLVMHLFLLACEGAGHLEVQALRTVI